MWCNITGEAAGRGNLTLIVLGSWVKTWQSNKGQLAPANYQFKTRLVVINRTPQKYLNLTAISSVGVFCHGLVIIQWKSGWNFTSSCQLRSFRAQLSCDKCVERTYFESIEAKSVFLAKFEPNRTSCNIVQQGVRAVQHVACNNLWRCGMEEAQYS